MTELPAIERDSICTAGAMRRASRRLNRLYDEAVAPCGLTAEQLELLGEVTRLNHPTREKFAEKMAMKLTELRRALGPLLREELLTFERDSANRGIQRAYLTSSGEAKVRAGAELWLEIHRRLETVLGQATSRQLRRTLNWVASEDFRDAFTITR